MHRAAVVRGHGPAFVPVPAVPIVAALSSATGARAAGCGFLRGRAWRSPAVAAWIAHRSSSVGAGCATTASGWAIAAGRANTSSARAGYRTTAGALGPLLEAKAGGQAVVGTKGVVEHHNIRPALGYRAREALGMRERRDAVKAGLGVEQLSKSRAPGGMMGDDEDADLAACGGGRWDGRAHDRHGASGPPSNENAR
jgi:hypothetical protein